MIKEAISKLIEPDDLTKAEAQAVMKEIMEGQATPSQIAGFLVALRNKGETADEIAGSALAMRDAAQKMAITQARVVDNCGTGGDGQKSLNVSTAASFVVAGAGYAVAKHGNRSVSSQCGSADVLEALGVRVDPPAFVVEQSINQLGIGFMFAPSFHPAMKHAMPTRKELGIRTVFNLLGPLSNPAHAQVQLIGVYDPKLTTMIANVMAKMNHKAGLVVHSHGWDEITLDGPTDAAEMMKGKVKKYRLTHKDFGLPKISTKHLKGGDAARNAAAIREILEGKTVAARPVVVANAAALIWVAERAFTGKPFSLKEAVKKAEASIDTGAALTKMRGMAELSRTVEG